MKTAAAPLYMFGRFYANAQRAGDSAGADPVRPQSMKLDADQRVARAERGGRPRQRKNAVKKTLNIFVFLMSLLAGFLPLGGCALIMDSPDTAPREAAPAVKATELYERAMDQYNGKKYDQARELFQQYIGQYPDTVLARIVLYRLGHCEQVTGNTKEALVFYSRVVDTWGDQDFWGAQAMKRIKQIEQEK